MAAVVTEFDLTGEPPNKEALMFPHAEVQMAFLRTHARGH